MLAFVKFSNLQRSHESYPVWQSLYSFERTTERFSTQVSNCTVATVFLCVRFQLVPCFAVKVYLSFHRKWQPAYLWSWSTGNRRQSAARRGTQNTLERPKAAPCPIHEGKRQHYTETSRNTAWRQNHKSISSAERTLRCRRTDTKGQRKTELLCHSMSNRPTGGIPTKVRMPPACLQLWCCLRRTDRRRW